MAKVKIYSTPMCPWCKKAKEFFTANKVEYQDFNVAEDETARKEMIKRTGQMGVPVIDIDGEIIIGYDLLRLKSKLGVA